MEKALYILSELSDRDFDWILKNGRLQVIRAGEALIREGRAIDAVYFVLEGVLSVTVRALGDREIARLSIGEVVGEMSFVDHRAPSATVSAVDDVQVWSIPRSKLLLKLSQDMAFATHFYQAIAIWLSHRLRGTISRWGYAYGYGKDADLVESENGTRPPQESGVQSAEAEAIAKAELARLRLDWLLNRMKETYRETYR